jgi:hypothetical protein
MAPRGHVADEPSVSRFWDVGDEGEALLSCYHNSKLFDQSSGKLWIRFLKEEGKEHKHVFWMMGQVIGFLAESPQLRSRRQCSKKGTWICE